MEQFREEMVGREMVWERFNSWLGESLFSRRLERWLGERLLARGLAVGMVV